MQSDVTALINTDDLVYNYRALSSCCGPRVRFCAPLKADAYGHGIRAVAPALQEAGVDSAAVAGIPEAIELRELGWGRPILVLGNVLAVSKSSERRERLAAALRYDLSLTVADETPIDLLSRIDAARPLPVHLKIDTGMGRMGATPADALRLLDALRRLSTVRVAGIYSHFATADFEDLEIARRQVNEFRSFLSAARPADEVIRHLSNSAATISLPEAHFDMVRPGLALYGYAPSKHLHDRIDLRPILRLVSHVSLVKDIPTGHGVGYGRTFVTTRPTRLGIVPVGYYDGFVRALSNASVVGTAFGDAPVVGRVSMDQLAVDLTGLPGLQPGMEVTLIDNRPQRPNSVQSIADRLGTIPYEVTCLLGRRVDRIAIGEKCAAPQSPASRI